MSMDLSEQAIHTVYHNAQSYCKFLSANDSGATGGHQWGILISKTVKDMIFDEPLSETVIMKRAIRVLWQNDFETDATLTYYPSKKELRITGFGKGFSFLCPENTGALFVFIRVERDYYKGFFLLSEEEIDDFLDAFALSPADTNRPIHLQQMPSDKKEELAIQDFIRSLTVDFPTTEEMAAAARRIQGAIYNNDDLIRTDPDKKLLKWCDFEYTLFQALEHDRYGKEILNGFPNVDEFIKTANMVLNRRKSRAGKSLEHHLRAIFDANKLPYTAQPITEGSKRPDFIFPSAKAYHDILFPTEKLMSLAAKTTCKDRWRQILNEANRLRDFPKYLCTLQQGVSPAQMDEMEAEKVILVVPKPYILAYPPDKRDRIWTLSKFILFVKQRYPQVDEDSDM